jgi:competence protein ComEA
MKNLIKLAILLLIGYLLYRLYSTYLRPTAVRLDQQPAAVPPVQEQHPAAALDAARPTSATKPDRINLNKGGAIELTSLPGIGPALADRIIAFREQNGYFESVDDLVQVQGIGSVQVERLRRLVAL